MSEKNSTKFNWLLFTGTVIIVFAAGLFTASIMEKRAEKVVKMQMVRDIPDDEPRNEIWGDNFPREYETYLQTLDTNFKSLYAGSGHIDYLERFPELVILWAGYGFSLEYNQGKGHAHAVQDVRKILRTGGVEVSKMPATCWTCKSPDVPRMMKKHGVAEFYEGKWLDKGEEIVNPIGCMDCHDNETMDLRISRPALKEAFERQGKKMKDFTHNEMRSLVCAQCHVEYYFKKDGNYLTFPWDDGFTVEDMEKYYDNIEFSDWKHKLSRTPMLKAQHPDYELFRSGVHGQRGVSCADCHMPYKVEGGMKFTDHHIQSPLNSISTSCQTCHRESENQLRNDVYERQKKVTDNRREAEKTLAETHILAKIAWDNGATKEDMKDILTLIRHAQWRWDWVAAANSVGFHSPVEALRVLGTSIQKAEQAKGKINLLLQKLGVQLPVQMPDISTKAKAQKYVGIDIEYLLQDKQKLLDEVVPKWDEAAKKRQGTLKDYTNLYK